MFSGVPNGPLRLSPPQVHAAVHNSGEIELRVDLIDARTKDVVGPPYVYAGSVTDILLLEGKLAVRIARQCGIRLTRKDLDELRKPDTDSEEAYGSYLRGRYYWSRRTPQTLRTALEKFHDAIRMDPNYALAHVGLAESYALLDVYTRISTLVSVLLTIGWPRTPLFMRVGKHSRR